jgi:ketosteroid isomerase-like protein
MRWKFLLTALALTILAVGADQVRRFVEQRRCGNRAPLAQLDDELNQAFLVSDVARLDCLLADDFTGIGFSGTVFKKEKMLTEFKEAATRQEPPPPQLLHIDERNICVYGETAIVTASATKTYPQQGLTIHYRYTHVFVKKQSGWVLTVEQNTKVL